MNPLVRIVRNTDATWSERVFLDLIEVKRYSHITSRKWDFQFVRRYKRLPHLKEAFYVPFLQTLHSPK